MPRGKEYSLRCPECGALLPDRSGGRGISSYVLIIFVFVIAPVGVYLLWPRLFGQQPLPPAAAPPVEVIQPAANPVAPAAVPDPKPAVPKIDQKPEPKPEPTPQPQLTPAEIAAKDDKAAARKLALVKPFIKRGETATARKRLKEIIELHSETPAADEAREMLTKLGQ